MSRATLDPALIELLRCPRCKGTLVATDTQTSALDCGVCRLRFAVRDGIPIMLIDSASPY